MNRSGKIAVRRDVLLVEIERRCAHPGCRGRVRLGLTKEDARAYCGFECERCKGWNNDLLTERDVPEWWEELAITGLNGVRTSDRVSAGAEAGETITRLSDAYRRTQCRGK